MSQTAVSTETCINIQIWNDRMPIFRSMIAKFYREMTRAGFKRHLLDSEEMEELENLAMKLAQEYQENGG